MCIVYYSCVTMALPSVFTDFIGLSKCTSDHRIVRVGESWKEQNNGPVEKYGVANGGILLSGAWLPCAQGGSFTNGDFWSSFNILTFV